MLPVFLDRFELEFQFRIQRRVMGVATKRSTFSKAQVASVVQPAEDGDQIKGLEGMEGTDFCL